MERLRAEAEVLSGLSHPNIVHVYDYVEEPHRAWLAEEWVDGTSLQAILDVHDRLTPEQSLGVVRGALTGLAYAHERGVVHRDVSTGNILADQEGTSKLVDFGLAAPAGQALRSALRRSSAPSLPAASLWVSRVTSTQRRRCCSPCWQAARRSRRATHSQWHERTQRNRHPASTTTGPTSRTCCDAR